MIQEQYYNINANQLMELLCFSYHCIVGLANKVMVNDIMPEQMIKGN